MKNVLSIGRLVTGTAALIAFALAVAVHAATIAGVDTEARYPDVWLLHCGIFPAGLLALLAAMVLARPSRKFRDVVTLIPMWARVLIIVAFIYAVANFLVIVPQSGAGDPVLHGSRFFFNDHGALREVSEQQFRAQRAVTLRAFSGHWLYLYLVSAIYLLIARSPLRAEAR